MSLSNVLSITTNTQARIQKLPSSKFINFHINNALITAALLDIFEIKLFVPSMMSSVAKTSYYPTVRKFFRIVARRVIRYN